MNNLKHIRRFNEQKDEIDLLKKQFENLKPKLNNFKM